MCVCDLDSTDLDAVILRTLRRRRSLELVDEPESKMTKESVDECRCLSYRPYRDITDSCIPCVCVCGLFVCCMLRRYMCLYLIYLRACVCAIYLLYLYRNQCTIYIIFLCRLLLEKIEAYTLPTYYLYSSIHPMKRLLL